jgi:hypothetical protein
LFITLERRLNAVPEAGFKKLIEKPIVSIWNSSETVAKEGDSG